VRLDPTPLAGAFVVEQERRADERGYFARTFDAEVFAAAGGDGRVAQCNTSFNAKAGTLRGMHFQAAPYGEAKLVRCTRGAIFDVLIDLRDDSPTHLQWFGAELSQDNGRGLFIPDGFAHGFQTLTDDAEVSYQMSVPFQDGAGRGVRWDDPAFGVQWPEAPAGGRTISERDATYPDFTS
jgi:dTDP-4-dehydrorhamnose 3,5-epimerase